MPKVKPDNMKIKAIAPWFGSKRSLAPRIVAELGEHRVYWSPFCGSMPVLLIKSPCVMETVNDLHGDLINLARVIKHYHFGPVLYRLLRRTLMHEDFFNESAEFLRTQLSPDRHDGFDVERAYHYFIASWLGRNGVAGTKSYNFHYCVRYTANGGHAAKRWYSVVRSIPAWRRRLANVTILRRDAFNIIERIGDAEGTAIYVDPPYLTKGAKYVHDFEDRDHARLAELLGRFTKARVVVSYYDDPRLDKLYPAGRWTKVLCYRHKALSVQGKQGSAAKTAPEVLLINGPSYTNAEGRLFE